jgi:hypothetical protein
VKRLVLDPDPVGVPAPDDPPAAVGAPLTVRPALETKHNKRRKTNSIRTRISTSVFRSKLFKNIIPRFHDHIKHILAPSTSSVTSKEKKSTNVRTMFVINLERFR